MNDINWNERPICPVCEEHIRKFNGNTYGAFCSKECQYSDKGKEITLQKPSIQHESVMVWIM